MYRFARVVMLGAVSVGLSSPIASAGAQESGAPTVAILPFNGAMATRTGREYEGLHKAMPALLVSAMSANVAIRVIPREEMQRLVDAQRLQTGRLIDRDVAMRVGKLAGAQHVIFGRVMADAEGHIRVDARSVNVESEQVEFTDRVQEVGDNVMPLVDQLAMKLTHGMHLPVTLGAMQAGGPASSAQLPVKTAVMFGKALDLSDRGDSAHAAELFEAVLRDYPDFAPAKVGLGRLKPGT